ncbi:MAG: hypothetical protein AABX49_00460 [Nanoarchaeota archaeon]
MNKKGLTWDNIVYAIIAIVVLVVLVWIFRKQINDIFRSLISIIKTTNTGVDELGKDIEKIVEK